LKNLKNKSCSKFQDLQLSCFYLFQILLRFWNLNLKSKGDNFWILINSKLLQLLHGNFENPKHQSCTYWQDLQLCFLNYFQIMLPFWNLNRGMKMSQIWDLNLFKITLNFILKLWKLQKPKLYNMTRSKILLFLAHPQIFPRFWIKQKMGKTEFSGNKGFESNSNLIWFLH
jgi:hypothetical protein